MQPRIAVEKGHVPFHGRAEFRIVGRFGAAQSAIGHLKIEILAGSHAPENRDLILNGMGSEGEHAKAALRHAITPGQEFASGGTARLEQQCSSSAIEGAIEAPE